jgi:hypothetical protein
VTPNLSDTKDLYHTINKLDLIDIVCVCVCVCVCRERERERLRERKKMRENLLSQPICNKGFVNICCCRSQEHEMLKN